MREPQILGVVSAPMSPDSLSSMIKRLDKKTLHRNTSRHGRRIQQGDAYGCAIACLAMACGTDYFEMRNHVAQYWDAFHPYENFDGLDDADEKIILFRLGFRQTRVRKFENGLRGYVGKKKAILHVPSLNVPGKHHGVFWTGRQLHDPSPFRRYDADLAWDMCLAASVIEPLQDGSEIELRGIHGGVG